MLFPFCVLSLKRILQLGLAHRIHSGIFREVVGMKGRFFLEVCFVETQRKRVSPLFLLPLFAPLWFLLFCFFSSFGGRVIRFLELRAC